MNLPDFLLRIAVKPAICKGGRKGLRFLLLHFVQTQKRTGPERIALFPGPASNCGFVIFL